MTATETERLRRCRLTFERAMREGISVADAARSAARERWCAADERLAAKRCGRLATDDPADAGEDDARLQWWQR